MKESKMESRHSIGDLVCINLYTCGTIKGAIVSAIKFTDYGKVLYDVTIRPFSNEEENEKLQFIIKDIDSYFIQTESDIILGTRNG